MEPAIYGAFLAARREKFRKKNIAAEVGLPPFASVCGVQIGRRMKLAVQQPTRLCCTNVSRGLIRPLLFRSGVRRSTTTADVLMEEGVKKSSRHQASGRRGAPLVNYRAVRWVTT